MVVTQAASASELIQAVERADSPTRLVMAVQALVVSGYEESIPTLITVLGYNNPEAAVVAVEGLVRFGSTAVPALLQQLDEYNYGARAYSFRALAAIGDPQALEVLLSAAETDFAPSVRRAAAQGLGNLRWVQLSEAQRYPAQQQALKTLLSLSHDPEWAIRYAAVVGLQALAITSADVPCMTSPTSTKLMASIMERLIEMDQTDPDLVVRSRVSMAQQALQHLAAS